MLILDARTGRPLPDSKVIALARRPLPDAIEAPFLVRHGHYFYLFVSFDYCCRGVRSTYNIRVGRAKQVMGPYFDRQGVALMDGGGTPILATQGDHIGPGHCAILQDKGKTYLVNHYYDGAAGGIPTLQISAIT